CDPVCSIMVFVCLSCMLPYPLAFKLRVFSSYEMHNVNLRKTMSILMIFLVDAVIAAAGGQGNFKITRSISPHEREWQLCSMDGEHPTGRWAIWLQSGSESKPGRLAVDYVRCDAVIRTMPTDGGEEDSYTEYLGYRPDPNDEGREIQMTDWVSKGGRLVVDGVPMLIQDSLNDIVLPERTDTCDKATSFLVKTYATSQNADGRKQQEANDALCKIFG
ncbi:hypothetical protein FOL47_006567, partial [Perkinsus chesapeaki]